MQQPKLTECLALADAFTAYKEVRRFAYLRDQRVRTARALYAAWVDADRPFAGGQPELAAAPLEARMRLVALSGGDEQAIGHVIDNAALAFADSMVRFVEVQFLERVADEDTQTSLTLGAHDTDAPPAPEPKEEPTQVPFPAAPSYAPVEDHAVPAPGVRVRAVAAGLGLVPPPAPSPVREPPSTRYLELPR